MQERLIPVLEARQTEKFNLLKDNVRRNILSLKGVDTDALLNEFDQNEFNNLSQNSSFFLPSTQSGKQSKLAKQLTEMAGAYDNGKTYINEAYSVPMAEEISNDSVMDFNEK